MRGRRRKSLQGVAKTWGWEEGIVSWGPFRMISNPRGRRGREKETWKNCKVSMIRLVGLLVTWGGEISNIMVKK